MELMNKCTLMRHSPFFCPGLLLSSPPSHPDHNQRISENTQEHLYGGLKLEPKDKDFSNLTGKWTRNWIFWNSSERTQG
jgi:hypothetical protein